ncbi:MAG TPA: beta-L-arabinofuranosidase domain-containing protein, partial [Pirellulales bacterium]|nr:beta-L-arabinofuranosidase domain-containing protein [Pirellulales bacterium]
AALAIKPAVPYEATPLPLADVRLTGGPLKHAQDLDAEYLLKLEPDRMLYYLRVRAGLEPKAKSGYGGWDGGGRQLTGHIAGHYLSAISYMYAATGDSRFKDRVDTVVNELREIQDKQGDGYIGGLMGSAGPSGGGAGRGDQKLVDGKALFQKLSQGTIRSGGFDLNGMWSPWYVQHKIFAGLRDAYRIAGNRTSLEVEKKLASWVDGILANLTDDQLQRMLATEFGGMNEVLADLYADTGDKRWLALSDKFEHKAIVNPLAEKNDILNGKHGNTLVPKLLGELMRYVYTGNELDGEAARFFFEEVAFHHSFATGGHGRNEYFGHADVLNPMIEGRTAESCNVYNMLKMSREMFGIDPDIRYADFHERALFNHILASINPETGQTSYMVPVGQGVMQEYQTMLGAGESFTCCVGTGMESHALHGYGVFYESGNELWVNLFAPCAADWKSKGVTLQMDTSFPEGDAATLKVTVDSPKEFTLRIRRPYWAADGFELKVNGEAMGNLPKPDSYVEIKRTWKTGDTVALALPKTLWKATLPDNPDKAALMWGPLVLAGDMSSMNSTPRGRGRSGARGGPPPNYPIFVSDEKSVDKWLLPVAGAPGTFKASSRSPTGGPNTDVTFIPFFKMHDKRYGIYWDIMTNADWDKRAGQLAAEQAKQQKLTAATVGYAQPGEMQMERDFNYQAGEESQPVRTQDRGGRRAATWFSFDLPVDTKHPMTLVVTYRSDEQARRQFEVQVDGKKVGEQMINRPGPQEQANFFDVEYAIPAEAVKDKPKVTVRFQAEKGSEVGRVFGIRMIRADAEK